MSWLSWHEISERAASDAHIAARQGDRDRASELFAQAAEAECKAVDDSVKSRTLGITVVSAVSLWFKADKLSEAEQMALQWLAPGRLPAFAINQLKQFVRSIGKSGTGREDGQTAAGSKTLADLAGEKQCVSQRLAELDAERSRLQQQLDELAVAERVLSRLGGTAAAVATVPKASREHRPSMSLADATLRAVQAHAEGVSAETVRRYLAQKFRLKVRPSHLGSALQRHRRAGRLEVHGSLWYAPQTPAGLSNAV